jgi:hypothetical protein
VPGQGLRQVKMRPWGLARPRGGQAAAFPVPEASRQVMPAAARAQMQVPPRLPFAKAPASVSRSHRSQFR